MQDPLSHLWHESCVEATEEVEAVEQDLAKRPQLGKDCDPHGRSPSKLLGHLHWDGKFEPRQRSGATLSFFASHGWCHAMCVVLLAGRSSLWRSRWFPRDSPFEVCNLFGVELSVARFRAQRSGASDLEFGSKVTESPFLDGAILSSTWQAPIVVSPKGNNFITLLLY